MRWGSERTAALVGAALSALACVGQVRAEDSGDATRGRTDGDLCLVVGAGAVLGPGEPRAEGELRMRYLQAAGIFALYEDALLASATSAPHRLLAGGMELRPLFFYRWLRGFETRHGYLDLTLDSLGLELGVFAAPSTRESSTFRPGLQVGLGIEVPARAFATGPWIAVHGGVRWGERAIALGSVNGPADRAAYLTLTLSWHQMLLGHLVDVFDAPSQ